MDPNENTKNEPGQNQNPEQQGSEKPKAEPINRKAETPRKCQICGSPNHHACGCESKARKERILLGTQESSAFNQVIEQPESETQIVNEQPSDGLLEKIFNVDVIDEARKVSVQQAEYVQGIFNILEDHNEDFKSYMIDIVTLLKTIAGDLITIRKFLTKEDEPEIN